MRTRIRAARLAIENDSILLIEHKSDSDEFWIPPSDGVEYSETFEECVIREMREETGLVPTVDRLMHLREFTQTGTDIHHVALFFQSQSEEPQRCHGERSRIRTRRSTNNWR